MLVRLCKASLVAAIGLLMGLVACGNLADYGSNWQLVQHVMSMDTIFPGSTQHWRAVTARPLQQDAYLLIIGLEILSAVLLLLSAVQLFARARSASHFDEAVPLGVVGLTVVMLLYGVGFLAIGGEWFEMWQSSVWNGQNGAARFFMAAAAVLIVLLVDRPAKGDVER